MKTISQAQKAGGSHMHMHSVGAGTETCPLEAHERWNGIKSESNIDEMKWVNEFMKQLQSVFSFLLAMVLEEFASIRFITYPLSSPVCTTSSTVTEIAFQGFSFAFVSVYHRVRNPLAPLRTSAASPFPVPSACFLPVSNNVPQFSTTLPSRRVIPHLRRRSHG